MRKLYGKTTHVRAVNGLIKLLNVELNHICHLLALLGAHHILHVSRIKVKYWEVRCGLYE
jgi:hypothetical protein